MTTPTAVAPTASQPEWATTSLVDAVTGAPNKIQPTPELELSGLKRDEPISRQHLNHILYAMCEHIRYLQEQIDDISADYPPIP